MQKPPHSYLIMNTPIYTYTMHSHTCEYKPVRPCHGRRASRDAAATRRRRPGRLLAGAAPSCINAHMVCMYTQTHVCVCVCVCICMYVIYACIYVHACAVWVLLWCFCMVPSFLLYAQGSVPAWMAVLPLIGFRTVLFFLPHNMRRATLIYYVDVTCNSECPIFLRPSFHGNNEYLILRPP